GVVAVVEQDVGRAFDELPVPPAVLGLVLHPRGGLAVDVDGRRTLGDLVVVRPAADGVDAEVVLPPLRLAVGEDIGGADGDRPHAGMGAGRTAVRVGVDLGVVSEACCGGHPDSSRSMQFTMSERARERGLPGPARRAVALAGVRRAALRGGRRAGSRRADRTWLPLLAARPRGGAMLFGQLWGARAAPFEGCS